MDRRRFAFSVFVFDAGTTELLRNSHRLRIPEQPARVLTLLLERAGDLVTREELRQLLWPDGEVLDHDHSINKIVAHLRGVLRDDPRAPRFVGRIPKRGYRFLVQVAILPSVAPPAREIPLLAPPSFTDASESEPLLEPPPQPRKEVPAGAGSCGAPKKSGSKALKITLTVLAVLVGLGLVGAGAVVLMIMFFAPRGPH